jgi:acyl carrier protein
MESLDSAEMRVRHWCIDYLANALNVPASRIDPEAKFARLGIDSATSVFFLVDLEEWLGVELGSEVVFEFPNIAALARYVATKYPQAAAAPGGHVTS